MEQKTPTVEIPLLRLKPGYVEFSGTQGVLRVLKPQDSRTRAMGLVFDCPRCKGNKEKDHKCIFLFDMPGVPDKARPHGRFIPKIGVDAKGNYVPHDFDKLSLHEVLEGKNTASSRLRPRDLPCKWEGELTDGKVYWRPHFLERVWKS